MNNPTIAKIQSIYQAFTQGNVPHILSQLNDNVVWVSEGCGNSPVNGSYTGLAGVEEFFRRVATTAKWDTFEPTNYIPMLDPNVIIVMGRAVGVVCQYPKAEWHFTHVWALDPATGKFRSMEDQWRVAHGDTQKVFGASGTAALAGGAAEKDKDKTKEKKDKDDKKEKKDKKDKK